MSVNNLDISEAGLNLIKGFEGLKLKPYLDIVKIPTIGYGTTYYENGSKVKMTDPAITEPRAAELLHFVCKSAIDTINSVVTVPLTQHQFDALVSFCYNAGNGAFKSSTLLKVINGTVKGDVGEQFMRWTKAGGVVSNGLVRRRQAELNLYKS